MSIEEELEGRRIEYLRYELNWYNGPPVDEDMAKGKKFVYVLTLPHPLNRGQAKMLLDLISQLSHEGTPEMVDVGLAIPKWNTEGGDHVAGHQDGHSKDP